MIRVVSIIRLFNGLRVKSGEGAIRAIIAAFLEMGGFRSGFVRYAKRVTRLVGLDDSIAFHFGVGCHDLM